VGTSESKPKAQAWVDLGPSPRLDPGLCPLCGVQMLTVDNVQDWQDMSDPTEPRVKGEPIRLRSVHGTCGEAAGWVEA